MSPAGACGKRLRHAGITQDACCCACNAQRLCSVLTGSRHVCIITKLILHVPHTVVTGINARNVLPPAGSYRRRAGNMERLAQSTCTLQPNIQARCHSILLDKCAHTRSQTAAMAESPNDFQRVPSVPHRRDLIHALEQDNSGTLKEP